MSLATLRRLNDEVFLSSAPIVRIGREEVEFLKRQASLNDRKRARICAHRSNEDALHEMIIAIDHRSYIHPHRHLQKSESFHIVEGEVDVVLFDDAGNVVDLMQLGDASTGRAFFYRLADSLFHTLLIRSDVLVVHETTNGPFLREATVLAPFAPAENDVAAASAYVARIKEAAAPWRASPRSD
jgi:cupin fold WbuC family metalloprotein